MKAYASAGLKYPVVTGETGGDDALLKSFGDEAIGLVSSCPYTLDLQSDANNRFIDGTIKNHDAIPGFYAAGLYVNCQVVDAGLKAAGGDASNKEKFMAALKGVNLTTRHAGRSSSITSTMSLAMSTFVASVRKEPSTGSSSGTRPSRRIRM